MEIASPTRIWFVRVTPVSASTVLWLAVALVPAVSAEPPFIVPLIVALLEIVTLL